MRVLIVEDEPKVAEALREGLEGDQCETVVEHSGEGGFYRASTEHFDLILLDVMLPGCSGLDMLRALRQRQCLVPVIVLTACDSVEDRVRGLDCGADDYLVKPFAFAELLARVRSQLRRQRSGDPRRLVVGSITLDCVSRSVSRAGRTVELTGREFDLLEQLMFSEGQVVSRETIARDVWKEPSRSIPLDNVIDVHIARLRRKLDVAGGPPVIHTLRGVGFMFKDDAGDS